MTRCAVDRRIRAGSVFAACDLDLCVRLAHKNFMETSYHAVPRDKFHRMLRERNLIRTHETSRSVIDLRPSAAEITARLRSRERVS